MRAGTYLSQQAGNKFNQPIASLLHRPAAPRPTATAPRSRLHDPPSICQHYVTSILIHVSISMLFLQLSRRGFWHARFTVQAVLHKSRQFGPRTDPTIFPFVPVAMEDPANTSLLHSRCCCYLGLWSTPCSNK
jgi:hypothetical protein